MRGALGLVIVLAIVWVSAGPAGAQALDAASSTALAATLRLLQDPAQRNSVISGNPQAAATDRQIRAMMTPELQEEFYALTAAIFAELVQAPVVTRVGWRRPSRPHRRTPLASWPV